MPLDHIDHVLRTAWATDTEARVTLTLLSCAAFLGLWGLLVCWDARPGWGEAMRTTAITLLLLAVIACVGCDSPSTRYIPGQAVVILFADDGPSKLFVREVHEDTGRIVLERRLTENSSLGTECTAAQLDWLIDMANRERKAGAMMSVPSYWSMPYVESYWSRD